MSAPSGAAAAHRLASSDRRGGRAADGRRGLRSRRLRHSFGTLAVRVFPLTDVKAYTGHADVSTTMIYVHHMPQHDAAAKLSAAVATRCRATG
jgi:integrase